MQSAGVESRTVELDSADGRGRQTEREIRYYVAGEGPPVVLLHGIGLDSATVSWRHAIPALAESHRVYAPDFPGHGESGRPSVRYTNDYFGDVLAAFLAELDLEDAALVGISMGGGVALGYALENGVDRLVLVDSYGLGHDAPWRPAASTVLRVPGAYSQWWRAIGASRVSVRMHLTQLMADGPTKSHVEDVYAAVQDGAVGRTVASWQRSEFRHDGLRTCYLGALSELDVPTLFVHGTEDPLLPASWSERAAERTGGELELLDNCGHWPSREAPERFNEIVSSFL